MTSEQSAKISRNTNFDSNKTAVSQATHDQTSSTENSIASSVASSESSLSSDELGSSQTVSTDASAKPSHEESSSRSASHLSQSDTEQGKQKHSVETYITNSSSNEKPNDKLQGLLSGLNNNISQANERENAKISQAEQLLKSQQTQSQADDLVRLDSSQTQMEEPPAYLSDENYFQDEYDLFVEPHFSENSLNDSNVNELGSEIPIAIEQNGELLAPLVSASDGLLTKQPDADTIAASKKLQENPSSHLTKIQTTGSIEFDKERSEKWSQSELIALDNPLDLLNCPVVPLEGEWSFEKWEYWLRQADLIPAVLNLAHKGVMTGTIGGTCVLKVPKDLEQVAAEFFERLLLRLKQDWEATHAIYELDDTDLVTPEHKLAERKRLALQVAEQKILQEPIIEALVQNFGGTVVNVTLNERVT